MAHRDEKGRFVRTKPDYNAMYEHECMAYKNAMKSFDIQTKHLVEAEEQRDYLLDHACPILRWMYNRKFKKDA